VKGTVARGGDRSLTQGNLWGGKSQLDIFDGGQKFVLDRVCDARRKKPADEGEVGRDGVGGPEKSVRMNAAVLKSDKGHRVICVEAVGARNLISFRGGSFRGERFARGFKGGRESICWREKGKGGRIATWRKHHAGIEGESARRRGRSSQETPKWRHRGKSESLLKRGKKGEKLAKPRE